MVGCRLEWRCGEVWEVGGGWKSEYLHHGEYFQTDLPGDREEYKNLWTGECFTLEKDEYWVGGDHFQHGNHVFSVSDPRLKIELSAKAVQNWQQLWLLVGRLVYYDGGTLRDAITDNVLFAADSFRICAAGCLIKVGGELRFTDGVREDIPLGEIGPNEFVRPLRVSETEYSIKVGRRATGYRYFLLDTARWTCI